MESLANPEKFPKIDIEPATAADAEGIRAVQHETWLATYPNEEYGITREDIEAKDWDDPERLERSREIIRQNSPDRQVLVAKDEGRIIGFALSTRGAERNKLHALYVLPEYQGKHVGRKLMASVLGWVDDAKDTELDVATYNATAIDFYKKNGFEYEHDITDSQVGRLPSGKMIPQIHMLRLAVSAKDK